MTIPTTLSDMDTIIALITALTPIIVASIPVLSLWVVWKLQRLNNVVVSLEKNTNHIREQLVAVTAESSEARGKLLGRAERTAEVNAERAAKNM